MARRSFFSSITSRCLASSSSAEHGDGRGTSLSQTTTGKPSRREATRRSRSGSLISYTGAPARSSSRRQNCRTQWINHEIVESWTTAWVWSNPYQWLKNLNGETAAKGSNPFDNILYGDKGKKLSSIVKCYTPSGTAARRNTTGSRRIWPLLSKKRLRYETTTEKRN